MLDAYSVRVDPLLNMSFGFNFSFFSLGPDFFLHLISHSDSGIGLNVRYLTLEHTELLILLEEFVLILNEFGLEFLDFLRNLGDLIVGLHNLLGSRFLVLSNIFELSLQLLDGDFEVRSSSPDLLLHLIDSCLLSCVFLGVLFLVLLNTL